MPARPLTRAQRQARADLLEDVAGDLARELFKLRALEIGQDPEKVAAVLSGPHAEFALVGPRAFVEPFVRKAIDGALGLAGRSS